MIDFGLLDKSVKFYESAGFARIESPWTVTSEVLNVTKPADARDGFRLIHENNKGLVASGEQSFLYLYLKGFLSRGQFSTITPCFRFENFDFLHTKYFIKNELIKTDSVTYDDLWNIIKTALKFFELFFDKNDLNIINTGENKFDINYKQYELGSYGIRTCEFLPDGWIYGTGCAEPRTSNILKLSKK